MLDRTLLLGLAMSGVVMAQTGTDLPAAPTGTTSGPQSPQWQGLSIEEKLRYDARHLFEVDNLVFAGVGAAFDQARDRPGEWGQGWGAFSERYASHLGKRSTAKTPGISGRRGQVTEAASEMHFFTPSGAMTIAGA